MRGVITRDGDHWTWVFTIGTSRLRVILSGSRTRSPRPGVAEFSVMDHYFQVEQRPGLRISELLGMRWQDFDDLMKMTSPRRMGPGAP